MCRQLFKEKVADAGVEGGINTRGSPVTGAGTAAGTPRTPATAAAA